MSDTPIELEYEYTQNELQEAFQRHMRQGANASVESPACAVLFLLLLVTGWESHPWWMRGLLFLLVAELLLFDRWLIRWANRSMTATHFHIDVDDRGLRVRNAAQKLGTRYWWSRLSGIEESEAGIELFFGNRNWCELEIPRKAFSNDDQRREFLDLANGHLDASRPHIGLSP